MPDPANAYPLILNKVASPRYATPTLRRGRLLDWLNTNAGCRAIVIAADAGYGKTTLLWQWEREVDFPCYWYKLDRSDRDWTFHVSYLIAAIGQRHEGFGQRVNAMLEQLSGGPGSNRPGVTAYLLAEMHDRLTEPCTFIIDDWQYVNAATEVRGLWNQILRDAPASSRFVFASRGKPRLQFARFKPHGGYAELRTDALRFTEAEIDELFREIYKDPLDPTELSELERRTEGWAASLQLVEVSLRERRTPDDRAEFIGSITGSSDSDLFDFLAEEVLDQQPEETRNFLLTTSILQQLTSELAERLAGVHDGRLQLADLEQRGLFTHRLDEDRYRYHHLFREFLERRLATERSDSEVVGLHIHAASYFETTQRWPEAIHHYLRAGLQRQAARLIAKHGEGLAEGGRLELIDEWLQQLPEHSIRENARLSLLYGEAAAFRGNWDEALAALSRARDFFARKGDRRIEALACLKLSTVLHYRGDADRAAQLAREGLALLPVDATATRLRLEGNLAITHGLKYESLESVIRECARIAEEASRFGLDHLAAIAFHNLGTFLRWTGRLDEATRAFERATDFTTSLPPNPWSDNYEYVVLLLLEGSLSAAESYARSGIDRTRHWSFANALARFGMGEVLGYQGRFVEAIELLRPLAGDVDIGYARNLLASLIEFMFLAHHPVEDMAMVLRVASAEPYDARHGTLGLARAVVVHSSPGCRGECLSAASDAAEWASRGAKLMAAMAAVKAGTLAVEHSGGRIANKHIEALDDARELGVLRYLRHWIRRYTPHADRIAAHAHGPQLLRALIEADPEGWRIAAVKALKRLGNGDRAELLGALVSHPSKQLVHALRGIPGQDVADVRRRMVQAQARRVFVRTLGLLSVHRHGWDGQEIVIDKRRLRSLLGLLAAYSGRKLGRDEALEILWPEASPKSAINSLNQAVFQLRRLFDPDYRDGESPQYISSSAESVHLNVDVVRTDIDEIRRLAKRIVDASNPTTQRTHMAALVRLVRGEFLPDLRYEDWAGSVQAGVHHELRSLLLPIAERSRNAVDPDLAVEAGLALTRLDEFDERAQVALATALTDGGRRLAARQAITAFAAKVRREFDEEPSELVTSAVQRVVGRSRV
jgi:ATP/maltotriose-dependent transcriptional regulator MalT/DNA-binding SARP family transcriptional activator